MSIVARVVAWFGRLTRRRLDDEDFQDEIRAHLAIAADEKVADGADQRDARYAALRDFGNITLTTEAARQVWTPRWLEALRDLTSDVRYAIRTLAKHPVFSLTVIGVLTLGIGLNAAVFTLLRSLALNPLAGVDRSSELRVVFRETSAGRLLRLSYADYQYLRDHDRAFSGLMGTVAFAVGVGRGGGSRAVWSESVTGNYFQVLGVRAALGRTLLPSDEVAPGGHPVAVLSDGLWRREFNADPAIVGRTIEINRAMLTVVGVADAAFHGTVPGYDVEVFIPVMMAGQIGLDGGLRGDTSANLLSDRRAALLVPHGHLRPGTTAADAAAQTDALWASLERERPLTDASERLRVLPFRQSPHGPQTYMLPTLVVLSAMGALVLLIACANIAGLVLVRGVSRRGELAVRLALGATRARIVRLLIVENLVLAVPGAVLGVVLAQRGIPVFIALMQSLAAPQRLFFNIEVDRLVIGFAALAACLCALVFGLAPALQSSRIDLVSVINEDASPRGASRGRLRAGLVVAQVAVSLLLLVGAGLVTRSLEAARAANPGFDANGVTTIAVDVMQGGYDERRGRVFYRDLLDRARADAGVESATIARWNPLNLIETPAAAIAVQGHEPRRGEDLAVQTNVVGTDYFRTLRIPVVAGRPFDDRDDEDADPAAIVNNTFAERFWGAAAAAIGKRVRVSGGDWRTVVGVAADVKYLRFNEAPRSYLYLPFLQEYRSQMNLHTRGAAAEVLVNQARAHIAALDPDLPIQFARPLSERNRASLFLLEWTASTLFVFGLAGMALAAMGTYGLVSYIVKQSTHEIGIRMALGATGRLIVRAFLARGLRLGASGAALGLVAALGLPRVLGSALFGVSGTDAGSFAGALLIVLGVVVVATMIPAWRASRTDPLTALRRN